MKDKIEEVKTKFLKNVYNHKIHVLRDDGVYRHLRFDNAGSCVYHFNLTTWPGYLCISGDMGCFVFSRPNDMFEFFRRDILGINPDYWSEKLEAIKKGGYDEFSPEKFKSQILEYVDDNFDPDDSDDVTKEDILNDLENRVFTCIFDEEYDAIEAIQTFNSMSIFTIEIEDIDYMEYTYNFLWCLYAIVWGIQQYDKAKSGGAA